MQGRGGQKVPATLQTPNEGTKKNDERASLKIIYGLIKKKWQLNIMEHRSLRSNGQKPENLFFRHTEPNAAF